VVLMLLMLLGLYLMRGQVRMLKGKRLEGMLPITSIDGGALMSSLLYFQPQLLLTWL
jgi:hypothetical protein